MPSASGLHQTAPACFTRSEHLGGLVARRPAGHRCWEPTSRHSKLGGQARLFCLAGGGGGGHSVHSAPTSHVLEATQDCIGAFFKRMPRKCGRCGALSPTLKAWVPPLPAAHAAAAAAAAASPAASRALSACRPVAWLPTRRQACPVAGQRCTACCRDMLHSLRRHAGGRIFQKALARAAQVDRPACTACICDGVTWPAQACGWAHLPEGPGQGSAGGQSQQRLPSGQPAVPARAHRRCRGAAQDSSGCWTAAGSSWLTSGSPCQHSCTGAAAASCSLCVIGQPGRLCSPCLGRCGWGSVA